ncbi:hypothetical protein VTJ83DRAFT_5207 [Remersonia thermophila]|uniref:Peptidase A1 domain-containing protein n=1 Tax=Remersonia thermophila TaxID=72144 RepID=A0ABR4DCV7_9PEZI
MSLVLLHWVLWVLCAPTAMAFPPGIQKRSFQLDRIKNPHFRHHNGPRQLVKAYQKYRMPIPQDLLDALGGNVESGGLSPGRQPASVNGFHAGETDGTSTGRVPATPANDGVEYISPIQVGGQTIHVAIDTGSADLWVFSVLLPPFAWGGHNIYDPALSPTSKMLSNASFSIVYGDGTHASGAVALDTVDVGGAVVRDQAVQMAAWASSAFILDMHLSGLLGLAFSKLNTVKPVRQTTFFENVMPTLAEPLFTADLPQEGVGAYEFGHINSSRFAGPLAWIPANTARGFWEVSTAGFRVANGSYKPVSKASAIVDTGTTLLLVSKELVDDYYSYVPGAQTRPMYGGVTFPCNATLPDLWLDVEDAYRARIRGSDINFGPINDELCFGGIQPTTSHVQIWGDIFFRSQFVVFHGGNRSLGMAPALRG